MIVLDLIVIIVTILFLIRWKRSNLSFNDYVIKGSIFKYVIIIYFLIGLVAYTLFSLIDRVDLNFLFQKLI